jgi:hypothetical protein
MALHDPKAVLHAWRAIGRSLSGVSTRKAVDRKPGRRLHVFNRLNGKVADPT